ncbi:mCG1030200, partial [Mus musculus]
KKLQRADSAAADTRPIINSEDGEWSHKTNMEDDSLAGGRPSSLSASKGKGPPCSHFCMSSNEGSKMELNSLAWGSWMVLSHHVTVGNPTWVLCENSSTI